MSENFYIAYVKFEYSFGTKGMGWSQCLYLQRNRVKNYIKKNVEDRKTRGGECITWITISICIVDK